VVVELLGTPREAQKQPGILPAHTATRAQHSPPLNVLQQQSTSSPTLRLLSIVDASGPASSTRSRAMLSGYLSQRDPAFAVAANINVKAITMILPMDRSRDGTPPVLPGDDGAPASLRTVGVGTDTTTTTTPSETGPITSDPWTPLSPRSIQFETFSGAAQREVDRLAVHRHRPQRPRATVGQAQQPCVRPGGADGVGVGCSRHAAPSGAIAFLPGLVVEREPDNRGVVRHAAAAI
jgi:hypothetical protein